MKRGTPHVWGELSEKATDADAVEVVPELPRLMWRLGMSRKKTLIEHLSKGLAIGNGCWEWRGLKTDDGQPKMQMWVDGKRLSIFAHRFIYEMVMGKIPKGAKVGQTCRNRLCVRPDHIVISRLRLTKDDYHLEDRGFSSPCWIWNRGSSRAGYGVTWCPADKRGRQAHRIYYERYRGAIPHGMVIDHLCRVPACVNPDHLEPVTHAENVRRGVRAKLTREDVTTIFSMRESGSRIKDIALQFDIDPSTVSQIIRGDRWSAA